LKLARRLNVVETTEKFKGLAEILGKDNVITEPRATAEYAVDMVAPGAVVFPKNTNQVAEVVKFSNRKNLAIVARGSGTKMAMGNPPQKLDLVVCTARMNHMLDVDTSNLTMTVEAGVKFRDIQARLKLSVRTDPTVDVLFPSIHRMPTMLPSAVLLQPIPPGPGDFSITFPEIQLSASVMLPLMGILWDRGARP
jgi:xanthine dehydrogenase iron-sulfur cluster and FAD-binding subunit A